MVDSEETLRQNVGCFADARKSRRNLGRNKKARDGTLELAPISRDGSSHRVTRLFDFTIKDVAEHRTLAQATRVALVLPS